MLPLLPSGVAALRIPHQTNAGTGTVLVGPDRRALPAGTVGGRQWTMPSLLVVTGPPGAGKSTVAGILADRAEPSVLVAGDDFFGFLARGAIPPWLPASNEQNEVVTQAAAAAAGRYAAEGFVTVYDVLRSRIQATLDSLPTALALGYVGTSHKNCKGIVKGIANACLLATSGATPL